MTYYILLKGDSVDDIWDDNILGEESLDLITKWKIMS